MHKQFFKALLPLKNSNNGRKERRMGGKEGGNSNAKPEPKTKSKETGICYLYANSPSSESSNRTPLLTSSSLGFRIDIFRSKTNIKLENSTQKCGS